MPTPKKEFTKKQIGRKLKPQFDVELALEGIDEKLDRVIEDLRALKQAISAGQD